MSNTYSITITMTPRQAVEAAEALHRAAIGTGSSQLFSASHRIESGLFDAGWDTVNIGTDDEPKWSWQKETP